MQKIGLISDTHNRLHAEIFHVFQDVDLILHAGDIGSEQILTDLSAIAPVKAVYGNTDSFPLVQKLKRVDFISAAGFTICLTHIVHSPKVFSYELFKLNRRADIVVFGHTHRASQEWFKGMYFINPGSASMPRHAKAPSVGILTFKDNQPRVEFIYLTTR